MNCYGCDIPITKENKSEEHIVLNSLGGKLCSTNLICKKCNNHFGSTIDQELYKQLEFAANIVVSKRDRKKENTSVVMESKEGKKVKVGAKMKPRPKLYIKIPGKGTIELDAKNEKDLRKLAAEKQQELIKKYGIFELTEFEEPPTPEKLYFQNNISNSPGDIALGGPQYFRAIGKMALNFYLLKKPNLPRPENLINFVNGGKDSQNQVFIYHPDHYIIHDLGEKEFSHIVYLRGEKEIKALYCYVELFNFEKFICIINDDYDGEDFEEQYVINLLTGKTLEKKITIDLKKHHVEGIKFIAHGHKKQRELNFHKI